MNLQKTDSQVYKIIKQEEERQQDKLSMIPSENFFSDSVREAVGSIFMHKYAEGNIDARYYEGNENVDEIEKLAISRIRKLFKLPKDWDANVQALAGSNANLAVYLGVLEQGDTMMGLYLPDGGHLSHGWSYDPETRPNPNNPVYLEGKKKVNITSRMFRVVQYKTDPKTNLLDYDMIERIAKQYEPKLIITGGTGYTREIDHKRMRAIADEIEALYMADIAHEAGLVAAGVIGSPVGVADIVTMTTHKTLRSGRGSIILAHKDLIKKINRGVLPGLQGGPFNNNIAGIAVGVGEALKPEFKKYAQQIVKNAKFLARELQKHDFELVSGGTDKHLILINLTNKGIYGKYLARALNIAGIVANMNTIPGEQRTPSDPSGLRLGTPWVTTRGMKEAEMTKIADWINEVTEISKGYSVEEFEDFQKSMSKHAKILKIQSEIKSLCGKFKTK